MDIIDVVENKNIEIKSWSAYSKEENIIVGSANEIEKLIEDIKKENAYFEWSNEDVKNGHYRKVVGKSANADNLNERIVITSYESAGKQSISVTRQITGKRWSAGIQELVSEKVKSDSIYFTVRGTLKEVENHDLENAAKDLVAAFSGEVKEGLIESDFVSLSAYNKNWDLGIAINQEDDINLQVGLRNSGQSDSVNVTIGTPIITTEY
jgi:hypothetical protein